MWSSFSAKSARVMAPPSEAACAVSVTGGELVGVLEVFLGMTGVDEFFVDLDEGMTTADTVTG